MLLAQWYIVNVAHVTVLSCFDMYMKMK